MAKKRLLHIALGDNEVIKSLWRAFDTYFETQHLDWTAVRHNKADMNGRILKACNSFKPHIIFMQIQASDYLTIETATQLSKKAFVINWTGDVRTPLPQWFVEIGRVIDLTLFTNMNDVVSAREKGVCADFLQVGFNKEIFTPVGAKVTYPDIVFLGSNYHTAPFPLTQERKMLAVTLKQRYGKRFGVYGRGWEKDNLDADFLVPKQEATCYRSAKISINYSHFDYMRYSSDRMFRIMGSGGFCLTHNFKGVEKDFVINKHCAVFDDVSDCITKIEYYLKNHYEREMIRKNGCQMVRENFTWERAMENMLGLIV